MSNIFYKVFTKEIRSLGLRRNPNILSYVPNEWYYLEENQIQEEILQIFLFLFLDLDEI